MTRTHARLAAWSLIVGTVVAAAGYLAGFLVNGNSDSRFAGSDWSTLYTVALVGDVLVTLGLPALFAAQRGRSPRLTLIGYVGLFVPMVVLNLGEGTVEGFAKPYLAHHGGHPQTNLPGLTAYEAPALLIMLIGLICLGIAVIRAGALPRWVGVLFIVTPLLGAAGLPGAAGLVADWVCFAALFVVGVHVLRADSVPALDTPAAPEVAAGRTR